MATRFVTPRTLALVRLVVAAALLGYLWRSGALEWSMLLRLAADWPLTLLALAVLFASVAAGAWRLSLLVAPSGLRLAFPRSLRLALIGIFFGVSLPGAAGGDLARVYYAGSWNRGRRIEMTSILVLDRLLGFFGLLVWVLAAAALLWRGIGSVELVVKLLWVVAAVSGLMAALFLASWLGGRGIRRLAAWAASKGSLGRFAERAVDTMGLYRRHPGRLAAALAVTLLSHSLGVAVLLLLGWLVSPGSFSWEMGVLIPLGLVANSLPLTPGGLGVGEAAMDRLFSVSGLAGGAEMLLAWRGLVLVVALVGLVVYLNARSEAGRSR